MAKVAIIGIGGRTGTMFAVELKKPTQILGVARERELRMIEGGKILVEKKGEAATRLKVKTIRDVDFEKETDPDVVILATKNPVSDPIKFYYQKFRGSQKIPPLLVSQNGIVAAEEAVAAMNEIFGREGAKNIQIIRTILFNPVEKREEGGKIFIKYSLPIKIVLAKISGLGQIKDVVKIFRESGFEATEFPQKQADNLEFSKLFLNLMGMAAATRGLSIRKGFKEKEVFKEEVEALKEYIGVVKAAGGKFLNFPSYPVKFLAFLFYLLPINLLMPLRSFIAGLISQERGEKPKDLEEIDYYNGAVVDLGNRLQIETPVNEIIYKRGLAKTPRN